MRSLAHFFIQLLCDGRFEIIKMKRNAPPPYLKGRIDAACDPRGPGRLPPGPGTRTRRSGRPGGRLPFGREAMAEWTMAEVLRLALRHEMDNFGEYQKAAKEMESPALRSMF